MTQIPGINPSEGTCCCDDVYPVMGDMDLTPPTPTYRTHAWYDLTTSPPTLLQSADAGGTVRALHVNVYGEVAVSVHRPTALGNDTLQLWSPLGEQLWSVNAGASTALPFGQLASDSDGNLYAAGLGQSTGGNSTSCRKFNRADGSVIWNKAGTWGGVRVVSDTVFAAQLSSGSGRIVAFDTSGTQLAYVEQVNLPVVAFAVNDAGDTIAAFHTGVLSNSRLYIYGWDGAAFTTDGFMFVNPPTGKSTHWALIVGTKLYTNGTGGLISTGLSRYSLTPTLEQNTTLNVTGETLGIPPCVATDDGGLIVCGVTSSVLDRVARYTIPAGSSASATWQFPWVTSGADATPVQPFIQGDTLYVGGMRTLA